MKYCPFCGKELPEEISEVKHNEVKKEGISTEKENEVKEEYLKDDENVLDIVGMLIGIFLPIVGAILYYVFKKKHPIVAKHINICSWIGFGVQFLVLAYIFLL